MKIEIIVEDHYSVDVITSTYYDLEPMPMDVFIARHDEKALNPHPSTGLPVRWEDETEERKKVLLKHAFYRHPRKIENTIKRRNGYFVTYKENGETKWWQTTKKHPRELFTRGLSSERFR